MAAAAPRIFLSFGEYGGGGLWASVGGRGPYEPLRLAGVTLSFATGTFSEPQPARRRHSTGTSAGSEPHRRGS